MPRAEAMQLLLAANVPGREQTFEHVLRNASEDVQTRSLAAAYLARLKSERAAQSLANALAEATDPTISTVILRGLGRIGGPEVLTAVGQAAARRSSGAVARQARFAATLIAHRFNLPQGDAKLPPESEFVPMALRSVREGTVLPASVEGTFDGLSFAVDTAVTATSVRSARRSPEPFDRREERSGVR
jgi:hypothetical protein